MSLAHLEGAWRGPLASICATQTWSFGVPAQSRRRNQLYLLLHNDKIQDVIDNIRKKSVLLLGRFQVPLDGSGDIAV
jgi:hypothetical protein